LQDARLLADVLAEAHHDDLDLRVAIRCYERLMRANGDAAVRAASPCITRRLTPSPTSPLASSGSPPRA
jgi:2-polyprenyl-6-methoxyphenol hydroxylase-like FAD-dependent oxidoreductase